MFQLFIEINHDSIPLFLMSLLDVKQQLFATSALDRAVLKSFLLKLKS